MIQAEPSQAGKVASRAKLGRLRVKPSLGISILELKPGLNREISELNGNGHEPSRKSWLEPALLGLITSNSITYPALTNVRHVLVIIIIFGRFL